MLRLELNARVVQDLVEGAPRHVFGDEADVRRGRRHAHELHHVRVPQRPTIPH